MADHMPTEEQIRERVTVAVCDIGGSTTLAERLDTESLKQVIGNYLDRIRRVLERYEATVERFLGSAIMGVFGLPAVMKTTLCGRCSRPSRFAKRLPP
jgi:class 3 adenylate cyclase